MAGQVQDGSSLRAGQAGGNVDDLAAQGGAACDGVGLTGECGGGAQQVVGDRRAQYPGGIGAEAAIRCASGPSIRSANTVSMMAWRRWVRSAAATGSVESVKTGDTATPGTARRGSGRL
jgi:hypothetical protein